MTTTVRTTTGVGYYTMSTTRQAGGRHVPLVDHGVNFNEYFKYEYPSNALVEITALAEPEDRIN